MQTPSAGERGCREAEGLESSFLTQKLCPRRFLSLSLSFSLPVSSPHPQYSYSTRSPSPIDLSWQSKQANSAEATQRDQDRVFKCRFTLLADGIVTIR